MTYLPNIPQPTDNLSVSQGNLLTNFQALNTSFAVNHVALTTALNNGKHTFIEMPTLAMIPSPLTNGEGVLYTKGISSQAELFYTRGVTGFEIQMTGGPVAQSGTFASSAAYQNPGSPSPTNPTITGGWTFLPGGLVLMYGFATPVGNTGTITFPFAFSSTNAPFSLTAMLSRANTSSTVQFYINSESQSGFTYTTNNANSGNGIYFQAIGV